MLTRGSTLDPIVFELLHEAGEAEGIPFTVTASARATGTDADAFHIARAGIPIERRLGPAALHALAGRDGAARRRRERGEADRGVRAAAGSRHRLPALTLLLLFDIDGTLLQRASVEHALALREAAGAVHGRRRSTSTTVEYAGRTDRAIARDLLAARRRGGEADRRARDEVETAAAEAYARLCPPDLTAHVAPGMVELLEELAARPDEFRLSLVTGNLEPIARLKLGRAGVGHYFEARRRAGSAPTTRTAGGCRRSRAAAPPIRRGRASARS